MNTLLNGLARHGAHRVRPNGPEAEPLTGDSIEPNRT